MNMQSEMWLFAVSVAASALGGMLGMASGIFIVPILTIFAHVDIRIAIGASILSVMFVQQRCSFSKESLNERSARDCAGDGDDGRRFKRRGSRRRDSDDRIRVLFVAVLVALAIQMFLAAFGNGLYRGMT